MFKSNATGDDGTDNPDGISVTISEDPETGEEWLIVEWAGEQYEDAWIAVPKHGTDILSENE